MEIDRESSTGIINFYKYFVIEFNNILKIEQEFINIIKIIITHYRVPNLKILQQKVVDNLNF